MVPAPGWIIRQDAPAAHMRLSDTCLGLIRRVISELKSGGSFKPRFSHINGLGNVIYQRFETNQPFQTVDSSHRIKGIASCSHGCRGGTRDSLLRCALPRPARSPMSAVVPVTRADAPRPPRARCASRRWPLHHRPLVPKTRPLVCALLPQIEKHAKRATAGNILQGVEKARVYLARRGMGPSGTERPITKKGGVLWRTPPLLPPNRAA